jgi:transposase InsO family protein
LALAIVVAMAREAHSVEKKLAIVLAAEQGVPVRDLCSELGVHRDTVHEWRRRFRADGIEGLLERSRRPHRSPNQTRAELEDEIVRLRKQLPVENGANVIGWHLRRAGWRDVPSDRTIHRILVRRGHVVAQPQKRPKSSYRRFEYDRPNECWQIDATTWHLTRSRAVTIMDIIDDHSRAAMTLRVGTQGPTTALALDAVFAAGRRWGLPAMVLSDNGSCFTTSNGEGTSDFEATLAAAGIRVIHSRPYHPQTCGKIERFHQSLKRWLTTQPLARTAGGLQHQLDTFADYYNRNRPHAAAGGLTVEQRHAATPKAVPSPEPIALPTPARITVSANAVNPSGAIHIASKWTTSVGTQHAGRRLTVIRHGDSAVILDGAIVIADLQLDPNRVYIPSGKPRGGPRRRPY